MFRVIYIFLFIYYILYILDPSVIDPTKETNEKMPLKTETEGQAYNDYNDCDMFDCFGWIEYKTKETVDLFVKFLQYHNISISVNPKAPPKQKMANKR